MAMAMDYISFDGMGICMASTMLMDTFNNNAKQSMNIFKQIRRQLKITQQQLADDLGISVYLVASIECGRRKVSKSLNKHLQLYIKMQGSVDLFTRCVLPKLKECE